MCVLSLCAGVVCVCAHVSVHTSVCRTENLHIFQVLHNVIHTTFLFKPSLCVVCDVIICFFIHMYTTGQDQLFQVRFVVSTLYMIRTLIYVLYDGVDTGEANPTIALR